MNARLRTAFRTTLAAACFVAGSATPRPGHAQDFAAPLDAPALTPHLSDHRGLALPVRSVTLSAPVDGTLGAIIAKEGEIVSAGDLVAQMDDAVQAAVVETARVRMESDADVKRAAAEVKAATAELDRVRA
ncbi:MAG: hypothetical protein AAF663_10290, partial [Planctomycetota bacterium]